MLAEKCSFEPLHNENCVQCIQQGCGIKAKRFLTERGSGMNIF